MVGKWTGNRYCTEIKFSDVTLKLTVVTSLELVDHRVSYRRGYNIRESRVNTHNFCESTYY